MSRRSKRQRVYEGEDRDDYVLHPTKGFRRASVARMQAASILPYLQQGYPATTEELGDAIRKARETGRVS